MIKVIYKLEDNVPTYINVSGHADYSEAGSDIVCSAVSMLNYGIANKLLNIDETFDLVISDNEFTFNNTKPSIKNNLLMETLIESLFLVNDQYTKYIQIKEV